MSRFIVDTQLPPKLSKYLLSQGFDSKHTTAFQEGHLLQDSEIIQFAIDEERIIVTKDQDFFDDYLVRGLPPKVLLLQLGNIGNSKLINMFAANQSSLLSLLEGGAELILFSKEGITEYRK